MVYKTLPFLRDVRPKPDFAQQLTLFVHEPAMPKGRMDALHSSFALAVEGVVENLKGSLLETRYTAIGDEWGILVAEFAPSQPFRRCDVDAVRRALITAHRDWDHSWEVDHLTWIETMFDLELSIIE
jgi:hypothetical protein